MRAKKYFYAALLFALALSTARADDIAGYPETVDAYDAREVALLPSYCKHTVTFRHRVPGGNDPAEIKRLDKVLGPTFGHLHHYCWGLMLTNRALYLVRSTGDRNRYLKGSIKEFDYVIRNAPADFPLLPEILTKKGENLIRLGNSAGVFELQRAMEVNPKYWPPYAALSDHYKASGHPGKARELLENGVSLMPDAKPLRRRLAELGGAQKPKSGITEVK